MATLAELEARYFAAGPDAGTVYSDNSSVEVLIDGYEYFEAVREAIDTTSGAGDVIYIVGWWIDHDHPTHLPVTDPAAKQLKELLSEKAAAGVDVRLVLWANPHLIDFGMIVSFTDLEGFRRVVSRNIASAAELRAENVVGSSLPPLHFQVLVDYSGGYFDSHHQKAVFVKAGDDVSGFAGGIDFASGRWDRPPHTAGRGPGPSTGSGSPTTVPWGWHDAGVKVTGPAAVGILENFRSRWEEAKSLPPRRYELNGAIGSYNPQHTLASVAAAPSPPAAPAPRQSVQVLRSLGKVKTSDLWGSSTTWSDPALADGLHHVRNTLWMALAAATAYIYIEDQAFSSPETLFPFLVGACERDVKVVAVTPGVADPHDAAGDPTIPREVPAHVQSGIVDALPAAKRSNFAFCQVDKTTVHSKIVLIDDEFLCMGSANFMDRSLGWTRKGRDSELSIAAVDAGTLVRDTRRRLWSDHLNVDPDDPAVQSQLDPLASALGLWRDSWATATPPSFPRPESKLVLVGP